MDSETVTDENCSQLLSDVHGILIPGGFDARVWREKSVIISGLSPDGELVEIIELGDHPWFLGCQFHPEFKSRPMNPHPLFASFIKAATEFRKKK